MSAAKLIYFDGCPNSKHARAALLSANVPFDVIRQDELTEGDPYKNYSSPTIVAPDGEIIMGAKSGGSCTVEPINVETIRARLNGNADKKGILASVGAFGSSFLVGFCPVCIPAIGAFLSSIGLGFMAQELVLKPLLVAFLSISVLGLLWSYRKEHGNTGPLILGIVMAVSMYLGRYVIFSSFLMYGSIVGLIAASIWNLRLRKKRSCCNSGDSA